MEDLTVYIDPRNKWYTRLCVQPFAFFNGVARSCNKKLHSPKSSRFPVMERAGYHSRTVKKKKEEEGETKRKKKILRNFYQPRENWTRLSNCFYSFATLVLHLSSFISCSSTTYVQHTSLLGRTSFISRKAKDVQRPGERNSTGYR